MSEKKETPYRGTEPEDIQYVKAPKPPWHPSTRWFIASGASLAVTWIGFNIAAYYTGMISGNGLALGFTAASATVVCGVVGAIKRWG